MREFDAVLVMVPHRQHERLALDVLSAGKHLLLEKPMAPTVEACDRILAAAAGSGTVFLVAENAQYWPEIVQTREIIESGTIGDVITARAWHCAAPMEEFHHEGHWRLSLDEAGGGVAVDAGSHWLRPLRMWLGERSTWWRSPAGPMRPWRGVVVPGPVPLRFRGGGQLRRPLSPGPVAPLPLFQVTGSRGRSSIDGLGRVKLYDGSDPRWRGGGPGRLSPELRAPDRRFRGGRARRRCRPGGCGVLAG